MATTGKKSSAKKGTSAAAPKKAAAKKKGTAAGSASRGKKGGGSRMHPLSILIIMGLLTVIIILLNLMYGSRGFRWKNIGFLKKPRLATEQRRSEPAPREKTLPPVDVETPRSGEGEKVATKETVPGKEDVKEEPAPPLKSVKVYFLRFNPADEKFSLAAVTRQVPAEQVLMESLKNLTQGPSPAEKRRGLLTALQPGTHVRGVTIRNNVAEIDFNATVEQGGSGTILLSRIDQIIYTATEIPGVRGVVIKINGRRQSTLGSDGLSISGTLRRH